MQADIVPMRSEAVLPSPTRPQPPLGAVIRMSRPVFYAERFPPRVWTTAALTYRFTPWFGGEPFLVPVVRVPVDGIPHIFAPCHRDTNANALTLRSTNALIKRFLREPAHSKVFISGKGDALGYQFLPLSEFESMPGYEIKPVTDETPLMPESPDPGARRDLDEYLKIADFVTARSNDALATRSGNVQSSLDDLTLQFMRELSFREPTLLANLDWHIYKMERLQRGVSISVMSAFKNDSLVTSTRVLTPDYHATDGAVLINKIGGSYKSHEGKFVSGQEDAAKLVGDSLIINDLKLLSVTQEDVDIAFRAFDPNFYRVPKEYMLGLVLQKLGVDILRKYSRTMQIARDADAFNAFDANEKTRILNLLHDSASDFQRLTRVLGQVNQPLAYELMEELESLTGKLSKLREGVRLTAGVRSDGAMITSVAELVDHENGDVPEASLSFRQKLVIERPLMSKPRVRMTQNWNLNGELPADSISDALIDLQLATITCTELQSALEKAKTAVNESRNPVSAQRVLIKGLIDIGAILINKYDKAMLNQNAIQGSGILQDLNALMTAVESIDPESARQINSGFRRRSVQREGWAPQLPVPEYTPRSSQNPPAYSEIRLR